MKENQTRFSAGHGGLLMESYLNWPIPIHRERAKQVLVSNKDPKAML